MFYLQCTYLEFRNILPHVPAFEVPVKSRPALPPHPGLLFNRQLSSFFPGVKLSGRETYHSPPSGGEVKNGWRCTSKPLYAFTALTGTLLFFYLLPHTWYGKTLLYLLPHTWYGKTLLYLLPHTWYGKTLLLYLLPHTWYGKTLLYLLPHTWYGKTLLYLLPHTWYGKTLLPNAFVCSNYTHCVIDHLLFRQ